MSDTAIVARNLSKRYRIARVGKRATYRTLREDLMQLPRWLWRYSSGSPDGKSEDFWALRDVSFEVKKGEVLGIIGRNGAGKSTLLKVLSRITSPTTGGVDLFGRVGSLLEVGTGFHPELSGRENIYLSGAILGTRRHEVRSQFDEIVAFAEVERFIDEPVKHYSSGMYARLAFAVAAHLRAEILLMDEVLAVGDAGFRRRCAAKVSEVARENGRTVVVVSHEPALIRSLCSRALLINAGQVAFDGSPESALHQYHQRHTDVGGSILEGAKRMQPGISLISVRVCGSSDRHQVLPADSGSIEIEVIGNVEFAARVTLAIRLRDNEGTVLALYSPGHDAEVRTWKPGRFHLEHRMKLPRLLRGRYVLELLLTDPNFTGWAEIPEAVHLDAEGSTTRLGMLTAGSHCGWMLLDDATGPSNSPHE